MAMALWNAYLVRGVIGEVHCIGHLFSSVVTCGRLFGRGAPARSATRWTGRGSGAGLFAFFPFFFLAAASSFFFAAKTLLASFVAIVAAIARISAQSSSWALLRVVPNARLTAAGVNLCSRRRALLTRTLLPITRHAGCKRSFTSVFFILLMRMM
jgi:hypothetical protein